VVLLVGLLGLTPLPWPNSRVQAATITVNNTADVVANNGQCTLREAIINANNDDQSGSTDCTAGAGADTIVLQAGQTYTLTIDTGADEDVAAENDLDVTSEITIRGNGTTIRRSTAVMCNLDGTDDAGEFRIFDVLAGGDLTLQQVTVRDGCADGTSLDDDGGGIRNEDTVTIENSTISNNQAEEDGGGILNDSGATLNLTNTTVSDNRAGDSGGAIDDDGGTVTIMTSTLSNNRTDSNDGGGIDNEGTLTITDSTLSNNRAGDDDGGIWSDGMVTIENSTISTNEADDDGGGIRVSSGTVDLSFVTIVRNRAGDDGGGIDNGDTVNIKESIVGNNTAPTGPNCDGGVSDTGTNLATDGSCGVTVVPSTGAGGLNLGGLGNNGGPTQTHALLAGSAAIDAASDCDNLAAATVMTDQRGITRPQGADCDVGAYEPRGAVALEGSGHCLQLETDLGSYIFIPSNGPPIRGQLRFSRRGTVLSFVNGYGEGRVLRGSVNLGTNRGNASLIIPPLIGGRRLSISDANILVNPTCP
jgi:CSLREA domain-containing protein